MQTDMNKLVFPKCGLALPYPELGPVRTVGLLSPTEGTTFARHTALSARGADGPSPPGLVGYNLVPHHCSSLNHGNTNRESETGYFKKKNESGDEEIDERLRGMSRMERQKNDRKVGLKVQSRLEDNRSKRTNEIERHTTCKSPRKSVEQRQNEEQIHKAEISPSGSNFSMNQRKETGGIKETGRRKHRKRTEVRAATDIRTGVVMGPYPGPFLLGTDLEEDDREGNKDADQTIWVCADGDRVRLLESPGLGGGKTSSSQRVDTARRNQEDGDSRFGDAERNGREDDSRRAASTSTREGDPSSWWVTDIPAARDCHQQNVEAIQDSLGCVFYQTSRDVTRGETLHVWYSDVMAHQLNIPVLTPGNIRGGADYVCTRCGKSFRYPNVLKAHLRFHCHIVKSTLRTQSRAESDVESRSELSRMHTKGLTARGSLVLETADQMSPEIQFQRKFSEEHHSLGNILSKGQNNGGPKGSYTGFTIRENSKERPQASPDSTTPESPGKQRETPGHSSKVLRFGETSAFSRPPGTSDMGQEYPRTLTSDRSVGSESQYKQQPLVTPRVLMPSPRAFSGVTQVPPGGSFVGQLLMPRPQTKYSPLDAYTLRYLYPEQIGNMAAAAALSRYQHAMSMMSHNPPRARLGIPPAVPHFIPTLPYMVPIPTVVPHTSTPVSLCSDSPQVDSRGPQTAHSPDVSPTHLPYFPMPSDKEGEPLDLLPRSLYMNKGGRKGHLCIYCGKFYSRKYGLKIHLRTHTGYKPLKCKVCLRPFGDPSNLNKHIRLHAEGETPYRCQYCGKVLVRRRDLERHVKSRHPNEADKDGLVIDTEEPENLQNSSGSGEARGTDTLLLGMEEHHSGGELPGDRHGDSDSSSGTYMDDDEDDEEEEEIEVVELENSDLNTGSLRLDIRC